MTSPEPVPTSDRIASVDVLRGAALFGILTVNIWYFSSASLSVGQMDPDYTSSLDRAAYALVTFLFTTKSYLLFAFLFGYSFVLQESAARAAGRPFNAMMVRRMTGLIALGLLQGLLLYPGDILLTYGLLGFLLLAMRHLAPAVAFRIGVRITLVVGSLLLFFGLLASCAGGDALDPGAAAQAEAGYRGSFADVLGANAAAYPTALASVLFLQAAPAFGAMLVGLAAARVGFFRDERRQAAAWNRLLPYGSAVGALGAAAFTLAWMSGGSAAQVAGFGVTILTAPLLTATYVRLLVALQRRRPQGRIVRGLGATGRLALSNYLAQSVAMAALFTGYGAGLMEQVSAAGTVVIALAIYAVQVGVSVWWLGSHRYGPAEWLLRRWTVRRVPAAAG